MQIELENGPVIPSARLFEIRRGAQHPQVSVRRTELPQAISAKLRDSGSASQRWSPLDEDLKLVAAEWDTLPEVTMDYVSVDSKIIAADKFPREFTVDKTTKGSDFAITIREGFGGSQRLTSTYTVLGVREHSAGRLVGTFVQSSIGAAPFPVPVAVRGQFQAYRVAPAAGSDPAPATAERSGWRRVLDVFSGCGSG